MRIYPFIEKYIYHTGVVLICFLLIQFLILHLQIVPLSVDFTAVYLPNAHNLQSPSHQFIYDASGIVFNADGQLNRFGTMPPLYSILLAFLITCGGGYTSFMVSNILLLVAVIIGAYYMLMLIKVSRTVTYASLWLLALNPLFIALPAMAGSESLFTFFLLYATYFYIRSCKQFSYSYFLLSILLLALSVETRLISLYLFPLIFIHSLFDSVLKQKIYKCVCVALAFLFLYHQFSEPVYNYYLQRTTCNGLSYYPDNIAAQWLLQHSLAIKSDFGTHYLNNLFQVFIIYPVETSKLYIYKLLDTWYSTDSGNMKTTLYIIQLPFALAFVWQLLSNLFSKKRNNYIIIICLLIGYMNLMAAASLSICRYLAPVTPFMSFLLAYTLINIRQKVLSKIAVSSASTARSQE